MRLRDMRRQKILMHGADYQVLSLLVTVQLGHLKMLALQYDLNIVVIHLMTCDPH